MYCKSLWIKVSAKCINVKTLRRITNTQLYLNVTHLLEEILSIQTDSLINDSWINLTDSLTKRQIHSFCSGFTRHNMQRIQYFDWTASPLRHNRVPQAECLLELQYRRHPHHRSKCPSALRAASPPPSLPELVWMFCCLERINIGKYIQH